jgi:hypothetical protein
MHLTTATSRISTRLDPARTYDDARAIAAANGGEYGIGLTYAREMILPGSAIAL